MDALPGRRARLNAARWLLGGYVIFATAGVVLHFFDIWSRSLQVNWVYQILTSAVGLAALLSLKWLRRSLTGAVRFFAWSALVCLSGILLYDLETSLEYMPLIVMFHVGVFTLGLILGFKDAIQCATAVALLLLLVGIFYVGIDNMLVPIALAYAMALPAKVVERLIEESTDEISKVNVKLRQENAERRRAEQALGRHRERLEELVRERTAELEERNAELGAFAHTVAHDLQNPLTVLIGFAEALQDSYHLLPDEEVQRYLSMMERSGHKMRDIIEALLLLAGVREMEVEVQSLDMASIVSEALHTVEHLIEERQAEVTLPSEDGWPTALGYAPWVEEVWVNYLSNAIKYGGCPPRVELGFDVVDSDWRFRSESATHSAEPAFPSVRFWVRDNGPGLTPEEQAMLFTPFSQLSRAEADGHGLGLSIVRRIVDKLGGQVGVESQVGGGSAFYFTLPCIADESDEPAVSPEHHERVLA